MNNDGWDFGIPMTPLGAWLLAIWAVGFVVALVRASRVRRRRAEEVGTVIGGGIILLAVGVVVYGVMLPILYSMCLIRLDGKWATSVCEFDRTGVHGTAHEK